MKFPRNARIFRGQLDATPFAAVFFLLVLFLMLSSLVYTPGVQVQLPLADNLPGTERATVTVAVDPNGRFYYENQGIGENRLRERLRQAVASSAEPLTLVVQEDRAVTYALQTQLLLLARDAGITNVLLATLQPPLESRP